jgi:hypothetical protein
MKVTVALLPFADTWKDPVTGSEGFSPHGTEVYVPGAPMLLVEEEEAEHDTLRAGACHFTEDGPVALVVDVPCVKVKFVSAVVWGYFSQP